MNEYLEEKLSLFLQNRLEPFSARDLLKHLGEPVSPDVIEDLSGYLLSNQLAYRNPPTDGNESLWLSRAGLFSGKTTVVVPTKTEIASSIFIPGSRLVPFYNSALLPSELVFSWNGKELPRKALHCPPDEVYPLYSLFGDEYAPQYLSLDNEENEKLFRDSEFEDPDEVCVMVVDMSDVYWSSSFRPGDRLVMRLTDWVRGYFEIAVLPASEIDLDRQKDWLDDMEDGLVHSFEISGPCASIEEQLAFAFFLGQETLFSPYAAGIDEYLRWSSRISFEPYGVETRLWFSEFVIPSRSTWNMSLIVSPASVVEDALVRLGLPQTLDIVDSYVLDALFRKEADIKALMERLVPYRKKSAAFCVPVLERYVLSVFRDFSTDYNWFADHEDGELRIRYVDLHSALARFVFFLQQSGIEPDDIPEQGSVVLGQLMSHTISALETIDSDDEATDDDIEALWQSIEGMEDSFFDTKTGIQEVLPELAKRRFSVLPGEQKNDE